LLHLLFGAALAMDRPVLLIGGAGGLGGLANASGGGYVVGRAVFHAWDPPVGVELSAREGLASGDFREIGGIGVFARVHPTGGWYARGGFAHHHEMPWDLAKQHPVGTVIGSAPGIRHRSGLELGGGGVWAAPGEILRDQWVIGVDLSANWFPDPQGPRVYAFLEVQVGIGVGKPRKPAATPPGHDPAGDLE
jgi:hypothetical protein